MHRIFTWLLLLGVIAGLGVRAVAAVHHHPGHHSEHACCDHGGADTDQGGHHDDDCPPGPHHHHLHVCCLPSPITGPEMRTHRLAEPAAVRLHVCWVKPLAPEEPVFALDKPPLI